MAIINTLKNLVGLRTGPSALSEHGQSALVQLVKNIIKADEVSMRGDYKESVEMANKARETARHNAEINQKYEDFVSTICIAADAIIAEDFNKTGVLLGDLHSMAFPDLRNPYRSEPTGLYKKVVLYG